jgi:hypothetical protein
MKAAVLFKIASVLLLLFAAGHTFGFLSFKPPSVESRAVYESMNNVHFQVRGSSFSYGGFYRGFGLSITVNMLFLAFLFWYLGALASSNPKVSATLGWALCAYFSAVPATLSAIAAVCLGWAAYAAT